MARFSPWIRPSRQVSSTRKLSSNARKPQRPRLNLEVLEDRTLPAVVTWIATAGGSWHNGSNWSTGAMPTAADDVVIPDLTGTHTITFNGTSTVRSISASEGLTINGGTLTVNGNVSGTGALRITAGTLSTAALTAGTSLTAEGGTLLDVSMSGNVSIPTTRTLTLSGTWSNNGTITAAAGSTLTLGGTFTTAAIGNLSAAGAMVVLTGTLNNTNATLSLNSGWGGDWYLKGGGITGGTITTSDGSDLVLTAWEGTLTGIVVAAGLEVDGTRSWSGYSYSNLEIRSGITLNGSLLLGNAAGSVYAGIQFVGTQIVSGTGSIIAGTHASNRIEATFFGVAAAVTFGPNLNVQVGKLTFGDAYTGDGFNFQSAINVAANGALTVAGIWQTNSPINTGSNSTLKLSGDWDNNGSVTVGAGSTAELGGTFTIADLGNFNAAGSTVALTGTLDNTATTLSLKSAWGGDWFLRGGTITGGTITTADGSDLVLTSWGGTFGAGIVVASGFVIDGTRVHGGYSDGFLKVSGGLTLGGTMLLGNAAATVYCRVEFAGTQTLTGSGSVVFGFHGSNRIYSAYAGSSYAVLTIDSGISVSGGSGTINGHYPQDGFDLKGSVNISAGSSLTLGGTWTNNGTITAVSGSTLTLGGTFTTTGMGNLNATGAAVHLTGTLNNSGATLTLAANRGGDWFLRGGTITGGTITTTDGSDLVLTSWGGTFGAGIVVASGFVIDGTRVHGGYSDGFLKVSGGLTLGGTMLLGNAAATVYCRVEFAGTQTLTGSGSVVFGSHGSNRIYSAYAGSSYAVLTIDSGISVSGGSGTINGYYPQDLVTINGTVDLNAPGTLTLGSNVTNYASGTLTGGTWRIGPNATLRLPTTAGLATAATRITLDGSNARILRSDNSNALTALTTISPTGNLTLRTANTISLPALNNQGTLAIGPTSTAATILNLTGNYTQAAAATLALELGGAPTSGLFGQFNVTGTANLSGTFATPFVNLFAPLLGQTFGVATHGNRIGTFSTFTSPYLGIEYDSAQRDLLGW